MEWGLERITSLEMAEWEAYERYAGPLNSAYLAEVLAGLHEQLQTLNRLTGAAHFTDKNHKKNPAPEPKHYPRPHELHAPHSSDGEGGDSDN